MLSWIFLALILYYVGLFLPSLFLIPQIGVPAYMGSRDSVPEPSPMHSRAQRATRNMLENLVPFLALAVLAMVLPEADMDGAIQGAALFVLARAAYLPLYLLAVPWVRSLAWTVAWIGLILMALALI
ncbi:MAPEG family protein [Aestuariibius sp. HNIBRBA575]|uniref:MAPEG family protein n=1 Tax=Aestuariibius sp. HNIBRBA575 TaxID=3233343 RepID=UPI0034A18C8C